MELTDNHSVAGSIQIGQSSGLIAAAKKGFSISIHEFCLMKYGRASNINTDRLDIKNALKRTDCCVRFRAFLIIIYSLVSKLVDGSIKSFSIVFIKDFLSQSNICGSDFHEFITFNDPQRFFQSEGEGIQQFDGFIRTA